MKARRRSTTRASWRHKLSVGWLGVLVAAAAYSFFLPEYSLAPDLRHSSVPPLSPSHWLGTDPLGQDVWVMLLYGARTALLVSLPAAVLTTALGTSLGLIAGYWGNSRLYLPWSYGLAMALAAACWLVLQTPYSGVAGIWWQLALLAGFGLLGRALSGLRGWQRPLAVPVDGLVLAAITLLAAVPKLLLVLAVAAAFKPSLAGLVVLLTLTSWTQSARLVRAEVIRLLRLPYLEAAFMTGLSPWRIMRYHLLPNAWGPLITTVPLSIAVFITLETTLSFLGVGLPLETPSWGRLLALSRLAPSSWWLLLFPGACLLATTLSLRQLLSFRKQQDTF